ncbi:MAG: VanZ family protein [Blautia sp.]|nr:VanZ family protein [Blautia sp.]
MDFAVQILKDTLTTLYQITGISLVCCILFMFAYLYCKEHGAKEGIRRWVNMLKTSHEFRRILLLAFYTAMILNKTLFSRPIWKQSFKNVIGVWGFYEDGNLYTENVENIMLFIPFLALLMWALHDYFWKDRQMTGWLYFRKALLISFISSAAIEMSQLFLKVGAIQISDLVFNTLGGLIGAAVYWIWHKHTLKKTDSEKNESE